MKTILTFIFQIFLITNVLGQIEFDRYSFVKANKLNLRSEPNVNSKILTTVNKGEKVKIIDGDCPKGKLEKIDGMYNCWAKVEVNGFKGFMFMGYLDQSNTLLIEQKNSEKDFVLYQERFYEGLKIPKGLNWYGVYSKSDGEYLEEVEIKYEYIEYGDPKGSIKLLTNFTNRESKFIIGSKRQLKIGLIGMKLPYDFSIFIFPSQKYWLPTFTKEDGFDYTYFLTANTISEQFGGNDDYQISMSSKKGGLIQSINKEFNYNSKTKHEITRPELVWFGDLDNDKIPDWMVKICHKECGYELFLSSIAKRKEYVRRIEK